ncbi:MAG: hypothetical protein O7H41_19460 [Planctomycetota bacterium]|nr:hypothetical protein [Planctomycetota bacterium]
MKRRMKHQWSHQWRILSILACCMAFALVLSGNSATAGKGGGKGGPPPSGDTLAPGEVLNLDFSVVTGTTVTLTWTRAADDDYDCDSGPASSYDVRYMIDTPLDESNWADATPLTGEPDPDTPCDGGDPPLFLLEKPYPILGLLPLTNYHFAIKASDEAGNASPISADLSVFTLDDGWSIEVVDAKGNNPVLAFDPEDGNPSIAYREGGSEKFAHFDGFLQDWVITDLGTSSGGHDLAYLSAGTPAMSYRIKAAKKKDGQKVVYALWNGTNFDAPETVAVGAEALVTSLAFDASGNASIVWTEDTSQGEDLMFATRDASGWNTPEVIDGEVFMRAPDLAYDSSGNATVAYEAKLSDGSDEIRFAVRSGSTWGAPVTVDSAPSPDGLRYPSLAYDGAGQPAIAYHYGDAAGPPFIGNQVRLAVRDASGWPESPEVITTRDDGSSSISLAFDGLGNPYVGFAAVYSGDCSENGVEVAFNDGSGWTFDLVTELAFCPNGVSLALDPDERPSVAIKDTAGGVLKFAWKNQ